MVTCKRIAAAALLLALLLSLCACSGRGYRDDVSVQKLAEIIDRQLAGDELAEMNSGYLSGAMHLDTTLFSNYVVKLNARGVNIDEYGLFRAPDLNGVDQVKDAAEGYLKLRRDTWMDAYMPEEKPKLENASVKVYGVYVLYVIAAPETCEAVFRDVEAALKK